MSCEQLRSGLDLSCAEIAKKYYQQVVLVNRNDVNNKIILTSSVSIDGIYTCRNRAYFDLKTDLSGFRFSLGENATSIFGSFDKSVIENIPQYNHNVSIVLAGVDEDTKCKLTQLDYADYFAALQNYDNTIELFGFEYGLTTQNYNYDPANSGGGVVIRLVSFNESFEDLPPLVYKSQNGTEIEDFNNNFQDVVFDPNGDYNDDFNNDFNNED